MTEEQKRRERLRKERERARACLVDYHSGAINYVIQSASNYGADSFDYSSSSCDSSFSSCD